MNSINKIGVSHTKKSVQHLLNTFFVCDVARNYRRKPNFATMAR